MEMGPKGIRAAFSEEKAFDFRREKSAFRQGIKLEEAILS